MSIAVRFMHRHARHGSLFALIKNKQPLFIDLYEFYYANQNVENIDFYYKK